MSYGTWGNSGVADGNAEDGQASFAGGWTDRGGASKINGMTKSELPRHSTSFGKVSTDMMRSTFNSFQKI